ncbi:MAG: hypothetical protein AAFZ38_00935 [Myxococcota bacterium]
MVRVCKLEPLNQIATVHSRLSTYRLDARRCFSLTLIVRLCAVAWCAFSIACFVSGGRECGEGTELRAGVGCLPTSTCGAGTVLQDGECLPASEALECGEGLVTLVDGACRTEALDSMAMLRSRSGLEA